MHRAPPVVVEASGLCVDGWIPVDPHTLETSFPDVYAVGDVTSVGTPKAGVFAEGQAERRRRRDHRPPPRCATRPSTYDGRGICYLEFGDDQVGQGRGHVPRRRRRRPARSTARRSTLAADKAEFGTSRIRRWFGREWSTT